MSVEPEIPHEEVRTKVWDPFGTGCLRRLEIDLITPSPGFEAAAIDRYVHFCPIRRHIIAPAETDMQDRRVVAVNVPGPIAVVRIGVQDGHTAQSMNLPEPLDGNRDIVETAIPAEEVASGVVTSCADEGEGIEKFAKPDPLGCRDHPSDRVARGGSERVLGHRPDKIGRVNFQDQLIGNGLWLEHKDVREGT
jgi:hypothetical protein